MKGKPRPMELQAYCTSGHVAQLMLIVGRLDPDNPRLHELTCPACNRTCALLIQARREVQIRQYVEAEGEVEV